MKLCNRMIFLFDLIFGLEHHFQQYFSYIMATSFSGGRSRSNLQSWARTHAILVIGLYELLGNPTT